MITAQRTDTQLIPVVRLLPPPAPDRQDRLRLTRRARRLISGGLILASAALAQPVSVAYFTLVAALGGAL